MIELHQIKSIFRVHLCNRSRNTYSNINDDNTKVQLCAQKVYFAMDRMPFLLYERDTKGFHRADAYRFGSLPLFSTDGSVLPNLEGFRQKEKK